MSQGSLVSIVLPTYNGARYIAESIQSCLDQTYPHWELIVVDDASTDHTPCLVADFAAQDSRIRLIRHAENKKLPGALNTGFAQATGQYLTWTSDDNSYRPEALDVMVDFLNRHPDVGIVYADYSIVDEMGHVLRRVHVANPNRLTDKACVDVCFMYRRTVYETIGGYDETLFLVEDYDYWLRASTRFRLQPLHRDLYLYRRHGGSLTDSRGQQVMRLREQTLARYLPQLHWASRQDLAVGYIHLSDLARQRHDARQACLYWLRAMRCAPFLCVRRTTIRMIESLLGATWAHRISVEYMKLKSFTRRVLRR
jgi:glycosyltransferase involved in cell wall biosynthesis